MLRRKMRREIFRNKTQFISIFLMAFLAVFIYTGVGGEWRGLVRSSDDFYDATNLADIFIMGFGFSEEQERAVAEIEEVTATERRAVIEAAGKSSPKGEFEKAPKISLYFVEKNEISAMYLIDGKSFDSGDADGIWLDGRFAEANELKIGDKLTLTLMGMDFEREMRGVIYSAEHVFRTDAGSLTPNFKEAGYAYLSFEAFPVPEYMTVTTLLVKADKTDGLEAKIEDALDGKYSFYLERGNHPSVSTFHNEVLQHKMMGDIFPIVFLLVALLTMTTTMTRLVNAQRAQIGTLKAMGFRKRTVTLHYISFGFWLSFLGSVLGSVVGPLTLPKLFYPSMSGFYTIPEWKPAYHVSFIIVALSVVALCTAVTWFACARQLSDTPATALRPKSPKVSKHSVIEKTALWNKIGFNTQWNLRDSTRNKTRSLMAVIGVLGCTALLVCAFGMNDSMNIIKKWQYEDIAKFESRLSVDESATDEQIEAAIDTVNGQALMETGIEIRVNGQKKSGTATITDKVTLISPTDVKRKPVSLPSDGVSITAKMANNFKVKIGDNIEWHIYGSEKWVTTEIAAIYRDSATQGLMMTRDTFEALGYDWRPTNIVTSEKVTGHIDGINIVLSTSDIVSGWSDLTEAMMIMVYILILGAAVLSIVVLYNLGLLSFAEMERDMATLKVMGIRTKKLRGLLLTQNMWFSVLGFVLGLPCGMLLLYALTSSSGESFDFPLELTLGTTLISALITFGLSIFVSLLFSKKIKKIDMVTSLKAIE